MLRRTDPIAGDGWGMPHPALHRRIDTVYAVRCDRCSYHLTGLRWRRAVKAARKHDRECRR
jgi:hypothetical protein